MVTRLDEPQGRQTRRKLVVGNWKMNGNRAANAELLWSQLTALAAQGWVPDIGKAVRVQLFKGNDYRFCIAVPVNSGVQITAAVMDVDGKPQGLLQSVEQGWGLVLSFKPKKTGVYAVAIRQTDKGRMKAVNCAMLTGYH